jgi:hypothetical protein
LNAFKGELATAQTAADTALTTIQGQIGDKQAKFEEEKEKAKLIEIAIADERRAKTQEEYDQLAEVSGAITEQLVLMTAENLTVMEGVTKEQLGAMLEEVNN